MYDLHDKLLAVYESVYIYNYMVTHTINHYGSYHYCYCYFHCYHYYYYWYLESSGGNPEAGLTLIWMCDSVRKSNLS